MKRRLIFAVLPVVAGLALFPRHALAHIGTGIAVDSNGRVYFADTIRNRIWRIGTDGRLTLLATNQHTNSLVLLEDGSLYIAEGTARRIGPPERSPQVLTPTNIERGADTAFTMDRRGNVYLLRAGVEKHACQIFKQTPGGVAELLAGDGAGYRDGKGARAQFFYPNSGVCGPDGSVFVRDGNRIRRVTPDGTVSTLAGSEAAAFVGTDEDDLQRPVGLAADSSGNVYVANYEKRRVFKISLGGEVSTLARPTWPWIPTGVAVTSDGVFVLERAGSPYGLSSLLMALFLSESMRVQKISPGGRIDTLATVRGGTQLSVIAWGVFACTLGAVLGAVLGTRTLLRRRLRAAPFPMKP